MAGVSAILTAAGESTRMGRPKPLLPWRGVTLVEYQISCLLEGGASEVLVVLGHESEAVAPFVERTGARLLVNPDYRQGRTTSIKAGLRGISPDAEAILLLGVDQPRSRQIISTVIETYMKETALITSPRFEGHGGHPLIFSVSVKPELELITEETQGVRQVFQAHRHEVVEVEFDDSMVRLDLNTPEAYEEARRTYGA